MRLIWAFLLVCLLPPSAYADVEAKRVVVSGTGGTRELALNNAFRHAVEQAVGMMVSSESYVKNLKDIQDKIFVASDGFIESYEVVTEDHDITGYAVTVSAVVRERKLNASVSTVTGTITSFDGTSAYANMALSADKSRDYHQVIIDAFDYLITKGLEFNHEKPNIYEKKGEYYINLGDLKISFNKQWEVAAKRYRTLLGDNRDSDEFKKALNGFPYSDKGKTDGWMVALIKVKDGNENIIYEKKFEVGNYSYWGYDYCSSINYIQQYLGFNDSKLTGKVIHSARTGSLDFNDHCVVDIGPIDKEDIARIKNIEFSIAPRVDYGGKLPLITYTLRSR